MGTVSTALSVPGSTRSIDYAVAWRNGDGVVATGRLTLESASLVLRGRDVTGVTKCERVPLERIDAVRVGRTEPERVRGERSVVLQLSGGRTVAVAPIGAAGAVFELADLVAELSSEQRASDGRVVVVLPLRRGTAARARELVADGPPFDIEHAELEGHHVFVSEREVVFLFEGEHARETIERLVRDPRVLREAVRWRECLAGPPRVADGTYAWRRDPS